MGKKRGASPEKMICTLVIIVMEVLENLKGLLYKL
jgi:hypothetical protein